MATASATPPRLKCVTLVVSSWARSGPRSKPGSCPCSCPTRGRDLRRDWTSLSPRSAPESGQLTRRFETCDQHTSRRAFARGREHGWDGARRQPWRPVRPDRLAQPADGAECERQLVMTGRRREPPPVSAACTPQGSLAFGQAVRALCSRGHQGRCAPLRGALTGLLDRRFAPGHELLWPKASSSPTAPY